MKRQGWGGGVGGVEGVFSLSHSCNHRHWVVLVAGGTLLALHPFYQESLSQRLNYTAMEILASFAIILPSFLCCKI